MKKLISFNPDKPEFLNPAMARGFLVERSEMQGEGEAEAHRLVKARKCATSPDDADLAAFLANEREKIEHAKQRHWLSIGGLPTKQKALGEAAVYRAEHQAKQNAPVTLESKFRELERFDRTLSNQKNKKPIGKKLTEKEVLDRVKANDQRDTTRDNQKGAGRVAVIESRKWSGEYRVRTQVNQLSALPVPDASGARSTKELTYRGANAIANSCEFMAKQHGGYKTFLTLTLDDEARARVASSEATIQKEVKRFFDGLNQVFKRGFQYVNDKNETVKVEPYHGAPDNWEDKNGKMQTVPYCWVIEVPKNDKGEDNPHLHVLLGWRIAYRHFDAWAARIESLWGHGFAHLEKIKDAENAGAYMAKAAGYLSKAAGSEDQGEVNGNRYWISKPSRAPSWACEGIYQMGEMGGLIRDVYRFMQFKYGHVFKDRAALSTQAAELRKEVKASNDKGSNKKRLETITKLLIKKRKFINDLPVRASKYTLILKGEAALGTFLNWAARPYDNAVVPKTLHRDGELKAFWLPRCFGVRRGWKAEQPKGTKFLENLLDERRVKSERKARNDQAENQWFNNIKNNDEPNGAGFAFG